MTGIERSAVKDPDRGCYVLDLRETDGTRVAAAGGKGASLGELAGLEGVDVPDGYCVTTDAFRRFMAQVPGVGDRLDRLSRLSAEDREEIAAVSAEIRREVEQAVVPGELAQAITAPVVRLGEHDAYAVRSSATAEDSAAASFAGQHDTYLDVVGAAEVLDRVRRCWASLFTERAVAYRLRNGVDHRSVHMAVVVQRMVRCEAAGVMFTADPDTSDRRTAVVEAVLGTGEALASGRVNPDVHRVRDGEVVGRPGGTGPVEGPVLTEEQVLRLVRTGRLIEQHFGKPQDIEWCLADGEFHIVQSRPVTTLFPVPEAGDAGNHVYVSVGHQQMMTDAIKPLGLSVWQLTTMRPMSEAGGRLFVDVTEGLGSPSSRDALLEALRKADPLTGEALQVVLDRGDFVPPLPDGDHRWPVPVGATAAEEVDTGVVSELRTRAEESLAALKRDIRATSGPEVFDFIQEDLQELKRVLFDPRCLRLITALTDATWWLNEQSRAWLGEENAADTLTRSAPGNVTSEMGLALLDVADVVRPYPEVVAALEAAEGEDFLDRLPGLPGGREAADAIRGYLGVYGMRCAGEIDITRPRWSERPSTLLPVLLGHVRDCEPGAGARRFEEGRQEALKKEEELLERLRALPDGERKAAEAKKMTGRVRALAGFREYPKYAMISRYFVYKQALTAEAEKLVRAGLLGERDDAFHLRFGELRDAVRTQRVDEGLIRRRKEEFERHRVLRPPRVITSDGETVSGAYRRQDAPSGALLGLPVSAGTAEGRARVVLNMADADVRAGDILVTSCTDPGWSPLFVAIGGLVTEVGGQMTHGAVIAREYGLPAVVGAEGATRLIRDGQRIRVNGTNGYVEILS